MAEEVVPEEYCGESPFVPCRPRPARASMLCSSRCCCNPRCWNSNPGRFHGQAGDRGAAGQGRGLWRPCWCIGHAQDGRLVLAGQTYGRVRRHAGLERKSIKTAGPRSRSRSRADRIPQAGDEFIVMTDERGRARSRPTAPPLPQPQAGQATASKLEHFTD